jgi:hypothetical protein
VLRYGSIAASSGGYEPIVCIGLRIRPPQSLAQLPWTPGRLLATGANDQIHRQRVRGPRVVVRRARQIDQRGQVALEHQVALNPLVALSVD